MHESHRRRFLVAAATHDVAETYRVLRRHGITQQRIAAACEQSQSEISEILAGRRVTSWEVLTRICRAYELPYGAMGLAYDEVTLDLLGRRP